jgi:hypothetical protein
MTLENQTPNASNGAPVVSAEGIFIDHYMKALTSLQTTWLNYDGQNELDLNKFNLQMQYLIRLLPDTTTQERIRNEYEKQIDFFKDKNSQDKTAEVKAGMVVVTELIRFITTSFDLLHYDVVGPVCDGQFISSDVLEIPDVDNAQK